MRRAPIVVAAATAALRALTACSVGEPTEAEPDGAPDPEASASSDPVDPTDPGCLVGDWRIAQDQMQVFYDAVSAASEGLALTIVGDTGLSFTDTEYLYTPGFTLQLEVAGLVGEGVTTGSIGGTWTADAGVITTAVGDNSLSTIVTTFSGASSPATPSMRRRSTAATPPRRCCNSTPGAGGCRWR